MHATEHFEQMLRERGIDHAWIDATIEAPERAEDREDGTRHFLRRIDAFGWRWLRVVVNVTRQPNQKVTAFFDRRVGRESESRQGS